MNLTIALERYDRHFPFFDGTVRPPDGLTLTSMQVGQSSPARDGRNRHARMLQGEFDVAEFSTSSYLMAVDRKLPIIGIPVFPRRLFSAGLFFVRADSGLTSPSDLAGKRVAIRTFQTTLSLLAKGDLKFEYGVPWEDIYWQVERGEDIDFEPDPRARIEALPPGSDVGMLLREGKVDAVVQPHPPKSITNGDGSVRRLFKDPDQEELRYFHKYGYVPIMHMLVVRQELVDRDPSLPLAIMEMHAQASHVAESYYSDPNWSSLVFGRRHFERQRDMFGKDVWPNGVKANKANLERFLMYSRDQGLIGRDIAVEDLFAPSVRDT